MRKISTLLIAIFIYLTSYSQISVTVSGNTNTTPNLSASYTSLSDAITALNTVTALSGPVTFNLAAGSSESVTSQLTITAAGDLANAVTFMKSGAGANPIITRTDAGSNTTSTIGGLGDAVFRINGTDNIHFDGLDVASTNQGIEYGYFTSKTAADACQNLSIKNSVITMTKGTSAYVIGIHIGNGTTSVSSATGVTVTANTGRTENVTITGNTIQNVHAGIYCRGNSTAAFYDQNFVIGQSGSGNIIQNFGGGSATTTYGIYFIYTNNVNVDFNTIDNAGGGGSPHGSTLYGTFFSTVSGAITGNNNSITLNNSSASSASQGLYNGNTVTSESFSNNTFNASTISSTGTVYLIYASNSTVGTKTINNNTISGTINRTGASGTFYCYYNNGSPGSGTETISGNSFMNVSLTGTSTFYGINSTSATGHTHEIFNNTISNITGGSGVTYGINLSAASTRNVYSNLIYGLSGAGTVYGISNGTGGATELKIYKNKIYGLSSSSTGTTAGLITGIYISSGTANADAKIYNNLIGDLTAPAAAGTDAIRGIGITSTVANTAVQLLYNSVYISGSSTGANFGSSGIYASTTPIVTMNNNLVANLSTPSGTGLVAAYRRSSTTIATYNTTSNNNLLYAGTPGASNLIFYDGTNADQTLAEFKTRVAPADASSVTENPPFLSTTGSSPLFLHINTAIPTQIESGGTPVVGITDDFDGDARNVTTPDIGADEFNGIGVDLTGPDITYTNIPNPTCSNNITISADINDPSGVNVASGTKPRLYFKKFGDANTYAGNTSADNGWKYVEASNSTSPFTFTLNYALLQSPVVPGDVIVYFVVAQDLVTPPNVGVNSASFNTAPTSVGLTASAFPVTGYNAYALIPATVSVSADPNPVCVGNPTTLTMIASQTGIATIGSGSLTSTTTTPYYGSSTVNGRRIQYLFTAAELAAQGLRAGNITSVSFNVTTTVATPINLQNWQIKMGATTETEIPTSYSTNVTTSVLGPITYTPTTGINTHIFTTPFNWDGTSNVIVEVCNDPLLATGTNLSVSYQAGPTNSVGYSTNAAGCTYTTATRTTTRPIMTFSGQIGITSQFVNFVWNDGSGPVGTNNNTIVVNPPFPSGNTMTYSVVATDANGCTVNGSVVVNRNTTTPTGTASVNNNTVCAGQSVTFVGTATMGCPPYTFSWSDGISVVGTVETLVYAPPATATYTLTITDNAGQMFSPAGILIAVNTPQVTSTAPGAACGPGPVSIALGATGSAGTTLNWYAAPSGGASIGNGNIFNTPPISSTTTYYVSASSGASSGMVGPIDNTIGTISSSNIAIGTQRMFFDVIAPTTLTSVDIYPTATIGSNASIIIRDNTQTVIADVPYTTTVTGGALQTITLNVTLAPGTGYEIGQGTAINLNRNTTGAVYPYTSSAINITGNTFDPVYYYFFYNWSFTTGCESSRTPVIATINPPPATFNVTGTATVCPGTGTPIGLDGSESGVNYQLQLGGVNTGSPVAGTGSAISFGSQTAAGTYTVVATNGTTSCLATMTGNAIISNTPGPSQFTVTGGGGYCTGGSGVPVGLSGSETGVNYQLVVNGSTNIGSPVAGTGVALDFGNQTVVGNYSVVAINITTTCTANMNGSVMVAVLSAPAPFNVTGGGAYCVGGAGVPVGLSGSESGVSYQLQIGGSNTGAPVAGTGAAISFGNQTAAGTYTVIGNLVGCSTAMTGSVAVSTTPLPTLYTVTGGGSYCSGGTGVTVGLSGSESGVNYQLQLGGVNTGSPIAGTGAAISFGNQTAAGMYTIFATNSSTTCTNTMTGSVVVSVSTVPSVVTNPTNASVPNGGSTSFTASFSGTPTPTLQWEESTSGPAGPWVPLANGGSYAGVTTGTLTINPAVSVMSGYYYHCVAMNGCPPSATTTAALLTVTLGPTSSVLSVSGSSTICSGSTANLVVTITGGTSPYTVVYTNGTTNFTVNNYVSGTNIPVSPTTNTTYSLVSVTDANSNPGTGNSGNATITVNPIPDATATPSSQTICSGSTITTIALSGTVTGTTYNWTRDNTATVTGIAASGSANISGTLTNTTAAPVTVTFTITPTANGCPGTPISALVIVNPTPNAVATPSSQTICSGSTITTIALSGTVTGTTYAWTRNNTATVTGIAASGSGNISGTLTNTTAAPVTVTFTITPTANGCPGTPITATVIVNPTPTATATPSSQTVCSNTAITAIVLSGTVSGTTYNWTRDNTTNVTGIANAGSGNISGTLVNTTNTQQTVTFTITPIANGCPGTSITATVIVNTATAITCPANITTPSSTGGCTAVVNYTPVITGSPAPTVTYSFSGATTGSGSGSGSGSTFNPGVTTVTLTATGTCGTATCSFTITVTDAQLPVITAQPTNRTVCAGGNTSFTVTATNASSYQWQSWNGIAWVNISGATTATLSLNSVTLSMNNNSYRVIVNGTCTSINSGFATLHVNPLPTISITANPSAVLNPGQVTTLTTSTNQPGGSYVWLLNGQPTGATTPALGGLTVDDLGVYTVRYTDPNGCVNTSAPVEITANATNMMWVYPNPNFGQFQVRVYSTTNTPFTLNVYDSKGAKVYSRTANPAQPYATIPVDLGFKAMGMYVVELRDATGKRLGSKQVMVHAR